MILIESFLKRLLKKKKPPYETEDYAATQDGRFTESEAIVGML